MMYRTGVCVECKKETLIANMKFHLCAYHNARRLNSDKKPNLYSTKPRKAIARSKIKVKDWKLDPRKVLDNLVSKYILKKFPKCFTCTNDSQGVGHYMLRANSATRYDEDNLRGQCNRCNGVGEGMREDFRARLIREIGLPRVFEVERLAKTTVKLNVNELTELIQIYSKKLESA